MSGFGAAEQGQAQGSEPPSNVSSLREKLPAAEGGVKREGEGDGEDDEISSVDQEKDPQSSEDEEEGQKFEPALEQPFSGSQAAQTVTAAAGGVATSKGKKQRTKKEWAAVKREKKRKASERRRAKRARERAEQKAEQKTEQAKKSGEEKERKEKERKEKERKEKEEAAKAQLWASAPKGPRQQQGSRPHQPRGGLSSSRGRGGFTPSQPMRGYAGGQSHPPARPTSGNLPWSPYQSRWSSQMGGSTTVGGRIVKSGPVNDCDQEKAAQKVKVQAQAQEMEKMEKETREARQMAEKARREAEEEKKKAEQERSHLARLNASLLAELRRQRRTTANLEAERRDNRMLGEIEPVSPVKTETPWDSRTGR